MENTITLYQLPTCPYCAKVRTRLEELKAEDKIDFEIINVAGTRDDETRQMIAEKCGCPTVPVINHGDVWMGESGDIIDYLNEKFA